MSDERSRQPWERPAESLADEAAPPDVPIGKPVLERGRPRRRLHPRGQHPQRLQPHRQRGRVRRHHRPQRRRQVDAAEGDPRPVQHPVRHGPSRRPRHHGPQGARARRDGRGVRAAESQRVPVADGQGEPRDGVLPRQAPLRRAVRVRHHAVPQARRACHAACRRAVGRRTADGGDGTGADDGAERAAARRAVGRALPGAAGRSVRALPADQPGGRGDPDGRAERPPLPPGRAQGLRPRPRPERLHRHRDGRSCRIPT